MVRSDWALWIQKKSQIFVGLDRVNPKPRFSRTQWVEMPGFVGCLIYQTIHA